MNRNTSFTPLIRARGRSIVVGGLLLGLLTGGCPMTPAPEGSDESSTIMVEALLVEAVMDQMESIVSGQMTTRMIREIVQDVIDEQGPSGGDNENSATGIPGNPGAVGAIGSQGPTGQRGEPGQPGERGSPGERGAQGQHGAQGERGRNGSDATVFAGDGIVVENGEVSVDSEVLDDRYAPRLSTSAVPLGAVIDWWRPDDDFAILTGYAIADGSTIDDPESPLYGTALPDLRDRFVRGVARVDDIGEIGGSDELNLSHSHGMQHNHSTTVGASDSNGYNFWIAPNGQGRPALNNHRHAVTVNQSNRSDTGLGLASSRSIVPRYVGLLKLVRIK